MTWYTMQDDSGSKLSDRLNIIFIDLEAIRLKLGTPIAQLTPEQIAKAQGLPLNKVLELQKEATVNA